MSTYNMPPRGRSPVGPGGSAAPGRPGGPPPPRPGGRPGDLGPDYLRDGYFDKNGNLLPHLVAGNPVIETARALGQRQGQAELKTAQLRRFYGKAKSIEQKLDSGMAFDSLKSEILTLQPLAANVVARGVAPDVLKDFIDRNVALAVKDERHFRKGFLIHFQSVVAYFTYLFRR